jgi:hypothetical protein
LAAVDRGEEAIPARPHDGVVTGEKAFPVRHFELTARPSGKPQTDESQ